MASTATRSFLLPHTATLCPSPLQIQKKSRRITIRRRMLRKSTRSKIHPINGPLDDIINEISSDLWESPLDYSVYTSRLDWGYPFKASSPWVVTPLPLSRAPSDQPLTIRKNRNSRSSTSGSSMGDSTSSSRNTSQDEAMSCGVIGTSPFPNNAWPSFEPALPTNASETTICAELSSAQQGSGNTVEDCPRPQRASSLRLFTNKFPRLRRTRTRSTSVSNSDTPEFTTPNGTAYLASPSEESKPLGLDEPNDEAVEAYMRRNAHK